MNDLLAVVLCRPLPAEEYYAQIPVLANFKRLEFPKSVTFFAGENGTGKSTLLEAIAVAWGFNPEGGSGNFQFSTRDTHGGLHRCLKLVRSFARAQDGFFLRSESFYNVATQVDELELNLNSYGGRSLHHQSHGESFLALMEHRFRGRGLYLLDEPEAALSPQRQLAMLRLIRRLAEQGSQFIIVTHSPILLGYPGGQIYSFDGGAVHETAYEQTESYRITELFIQHREALLRRLWEE